jgi:cell division protein FtsI/penicillin-binding protein 2
MVKLPGDSNWFPSDLGTNAFGQGIAVTPIQMLTAVASVANDGVLMKPYIVREFITQEDEGVRRIPVEPMAVRRAISPEAAATLTEIMVQVVEKGSTKAAVPGYRVAGKSGTAQIPEPYGYNPTDTIAAFVGFVPADDPRFALLIKLDRPSVSPWGTQTAAPAFKAIAERLLLYLQVPPDELRVALDQ